MTAPVRESLTVDELVSVLDEWAGKPVAARVVGMGDELIAVFRGQLGRRSAQKRPALFWPFDDTGRSTAAAELPGVYLHLHAFRDAALHVGGSVVEWRQGDVVLNLRRV